MTAPDQATLPLGNTGAAKLPLTQLVAAAQRELGMRKRCYPDWVDGGRMKQETATHEIKAMTQIVEILQLFCRYEDRVRACVKECLEEERRGQTGAKP